MPEPVAAADRAFPRHGGQLAAAARRYGIPLPDWLDLSTGINPVPYPAAALAPADLARLPDPEATAGLADAARVAYGVPEGVAVQPVPGTDIALRLLPLLFPRSRVAILSPTYSGHAEAWSAAGHSVRAIGELAGARGAEIVVLANPNNPDGRRIAPEELSAFLARSRPAALVVDEAFAEVTPGLSLVSAMAGAPILVLRSFGKFYGLAGLRLGFVLGPPAILERLGGMLGDWPVSGPAIAIGRAALEDFAWQEAARQRLAADRARLDALLAAAGFDAITGTDLFRLVQTPAAPRLHEALAAQGIWTRLFEESPDQIRLGLPPPGAFARLEAALARYRS